MNFHVVAGLPRAGSTLLCNLLNQNPRFYASSTSVISQVLSSMSATWSRIPEIKSDLNRDREDTQDRMRRAMRSVVTEWYRERGDVVFDKGRGWNSASLLLRDLFPESKIIVCVRDLRAVFASIEKQHQKFPILDDAQGPLGRGLYQRADQLFSPDGIIGQNVLGVEDILRRDSRYVQIVQFETFVKNPKLVMQAIYATLGEEYFAHDFDNVENTATDLDALYGFKFPHEGAGKVEPPDETEWQKYVSSDIAQLIMQKFAGYNRAFGYAA